MKPQRIAETIKTLKMFKRLCDASKVDRIIAVGTAAVRRAKNQRSFLDEIQVSCNITIRVLSEEEEALLVYRGVINSMDIPKGLILEIGVGKMTILPIWRIICRAMMSSSVVEARNSPPESRNRVRRRCTPIFRY